jgi:GH15 family glucan-1,4-alpha-glucosidase
MRAGVDTYLWQMPINRFARMINRSSGDGWDIDTTIDASLAGLWMFGMYSADDPKIVATMQAIRQKLWVNTSIGGLARYEDDRYRQVSQDIQNVPGNPWFICTLWLAEWYAVTAKNMDDLRKTLELLEWSAEHALPSGILAEQIHPYTHEPLSVSPLTWSHAAFVSAVLTYLQNKARVTMDQK